MWTQTKNNFILQQGFQEPSPEQCPRQYGALQFQPRAVLLWIMVGILSQSPLVFYTLAGVLWWSALLPKLNPFDALWNLGFKGNKVGSFHLAPAPAPRRTAQGMAGTFAAACGLFLHFGLVGAAYVSELIFLTAVLALVVAGFCLGSFTYHLVTGESTFACETLPWTTRSSTLNQNTTTSEGNRRGAKECVSVQRDVHTK
jgi:Domain of unknown function (DUF4395)